MSYEVLFILIVLLLLVLVNWRAAVWKDRADIECRKRKHAGYGYIYFYRGKRENPFFVKIGRTKNWNQRLAAARTSVSPHGIHILGATLVKDDVAAEKFIHQKFHKLRRFNDRRNEWFKLTPGLWLYLQRIKNRTVTKEAKKALEY